jgi:diguanylate cyclase (GGDEF)-like protein
VVDDEPALGRLFSLILKQAGMVTEVVTQPLKVMEAVVDFAPDLILMDVYMPQCSGVELAMVIRQQEAYVGIPIVFLSIESDVAKQLDAMRRGGDDFLMKPVQPAQLVAAVTHRAIRARVLQHMMQSDSLTGLLNHTKIKEQLVVELDRSRRTGTSLALAMIDIDHFKLVNDSYSHATGDRVLRSLARFLTQHLRQTDVIGRYGGEEFAVILNGSDAASAVRVLDKVRAAFTASWHWHEDAKFRVTFSVGVATAPPHTIASSLYDAADEALYKAKQAGRNRVYLSDRMPAPARPHTT